MSAVIEKLEAQASQLLDGFIGLRETYALLDPMLFDRETIASRGSFGQRNGFLILRRSLLLACVQDIGRLCLDSDERAPSIPRLIAQLRNQSLRDELRRRYCVFGGEPARTESDPDIIRLLADIAQREQTARGDEFDRYFARLLTSWDELSNGSALTEILTVRDQVSSHAEDHAGRRRYLLADITRLGIDLTGLQPTIQAMQEQVALIETMVHAAGFSWNSLSRQLADAVQGFWTSTDTQDMR
jgi:hypothetical protein